MKFARKNKYHKLGRDAARQSKNVETFSKTTKNNDQEKFRLRRETSRERIHHRTREGETKTNDR